MSTPVHKVRLSIDVEPEIRKRVKIAAAEHELTVREYILRAVRRALEEEKSAEARDWSRLSEAVFARDWNSEADAVYDHL